MALNCESRVRLGSGWHTIAVARRVRNNEKLRGQVGSVEHPVGLARGNQDSLPRAQLVLRSIHFDRQGSLKDIEELRRTAMVMPDFGGAWRHSLFNHAQQRRLHQAPSVAPVAPG